MLAILYTIDDMNYLPIGIAPEIRAELALQKLSYQDLADMTGLSAVSISRKVGTEKRELTSSDIWKISQALGIPLSILFARAERRLSSPSAEHLEVA